MPTFHVDHTGSNPVGGTHESRSRSERRGLGLPPWRNRQTRCPQKALSIRAWGFKSLGGHGGACGNPYSARATKSAQVIAWRSPCAWGGRGRSRRPPQSGLVAQLVARLRGTEEVRGSIPLWSTIESRRVHHTKWCEPSSCSRQVRHPPLLSVTGWKFGQCTGRASEWSEGMCPSLRFGVWRRLVARWSGGPEVAGSNPAIPTRHCASGRSGPPTACFCPYRCRFVNGSWGKAPPSIFRFE